MKLIRFVASSSSSSSDLGQLPSLEETPITLGVDSLGLGGETIVILVCCLIKTDALRNGPRACLNGLTGIL